MKTSNDPALYTIHANGTLMGTFIAADEDAALDVYALDAGYADFADLLERVPESTREEVTVTKVADLTEAIAFLGATEHADGRLFSTGGNVDDDGTDGPILLTRADVERLAVLLVTTSGDDVDAFNAWGGSSIGTDKVAVASVKAGEADGSVDAHLVVIVEGSVTECEVTLHHDNGQPTVRRRHPLGTCGTPLYGWADDTLVTTIEEAKEADEDFDPRDLIGEIVHAVDEAAIAAGL